MFNIETIPPIKIKSCVSGNAKIVFEDNKMSLYLNNSLISDMNNNNNINIKEMYSMYDLANGNVCIIGLDFGILPVWIASKESVLSVTVVESNQDLIDLFYLNNLNTNKINIIKEFNNEMYDYLFIHKINSLKLKEIIKYINDVAFMVNHKSLWFLGLEKMVAEHDFVLESHISRCYGAENCCCTSSTIAYQMSRKNIDFYSNFKYILNVNFPSLLIPDLAKEKINEYVYTYYNRIGYGNIFDK